MFMLEGWFYVVRQTSIRMPPWHSARREDRGEEMTANDTADKLLQLLRERHLRDVFVDECKNGPTWFGSHRRMDAWAMNRSWTRSMFWGYEIKTSHADFMKDDKWEDYLPLCTRFYFVAPLGLIDPTEVKSPAGLLVPSRHWKRLNKAKHAEQLHAGNHIYSLPEFAAMLLYIIMSRSIIVSPTKHWHYHHGGLVMFDRYDPPVDDLLEIIDSDNRRRNAFAANKVEAKIVERPNDK
jgi:hypothetical protein